MGGTAGTVDFEIEWWANNSWGLHDIDRTILTGTVMIYSDGSRTNNVSTRHFKHYFVPSGEVQAHTIYLRPENAAYEIDDQKRSARYRKCMCWWDPHVEREPSGASCDAAAQRVLGQAHRMSEGTVAGVPVVRYSDTTSAKRHEAAFARGENCRLMEELRIRYNTWGLPTSMHWFTVRSYSAGEPGYGSRLPPLGYAIHDGAGH